MRREVMQQALDALKSCNKSGMFDTEVNALRAELAKPSADVVRDEKRPDALGIMRNARELSDRCQELARRLVKAGTAERNAERYRWLRDVECFVWPSIKRVELDEASSVSLWIQPDVAMDSEGIDAAIDAAMERQS